VVRRLWLDQKRRLGMGQNLIRLYIWISFRLLKINGNRQFAVS